MVLTIRFGCFVLCGDGAGAGENYTARHFYCTCEYGLNDSLYNLSPMRWAQLRRGENALLLYSTTRLAVVHRHDAQLARL